MVDQSPVQNEIVSPLFKTLKIPRQQQQHTEPVPGLCKCRAFCELDITLYQTRKRGKKDNVMWEEKWKDLGMDPRVC